MRGISTSSGKGERDIKWMGSLYLYTVSLIFFGVYASLDLPYQRKSLKTYYTILVSGYSSLNHLALSLRPSPPHLPEDINSGS